MKRYALVVGIAHYQYALPNIKTSHLNAEAVAQVLEEHGDFQVTRLPAKWLSSDRVEVAKGKLTSEELTKALKNFLLEKAKYSEAVIYFSGHGIAVVNDLDDETEGFLATSDCEIEMEEGQIKWQKNGISLRRLNNLIRKSKVSSLVVLLDCSHAGYLVENDLVKQMLTEFQAKDYYLIAACRPKEKAYEGAKYSLFTEALLKGLSREQAGTDGKINCDQVFAVINEELKGKGQEPMRLSSGRSPILVSYPEQSQVEAVESLLDENGELCCPYRGLMAFTKAEHPFFFGRKQVVEELSRKLERQSFVPLIGASGSGKSSVVLAGLVPWLEELGWQVLYPLKPGLKPLERLETVLRKNYFSEEEQLLDECIYDESSEGLKPLLKRFPQGRHLLVVDQFEELFTVAEAKQRDRFIQLITQVAELPNYPLAIVTTMRADFLEPCLNYDSLRQLIEVNTIYLPTLAGKNLIDAICEPAKRQGYVVTDELLNQILQEIKQEPGFLPLLEFVLTELWARRDIERKLLTLERYQSLGGLTGALALYAERVYHYCDFYTELPVEKRSKQEKKWIKLIFLRLVRIGEQETITRRRQPKTSLLAIAHDTPEEEIALIKLLENLILARFLVTGQEYQDKEPWVCLAHEALTQAWSRGRDWIEENKIALISIQRTTEAATEWQNSGREEDFLLKGIKLHQARELSELLGKDFLSGLTQEFVQQSIQKYNVLKNLSELKQYLTDCSAEVVRAQNTMQDLDATLSDSEEFSKLLENLELCVAALATHPKNLREMIDKINKRSQLWPASVSHKEDSGC